MGLKIGENNTPLTWQAKGLIAAAVIIAAGALTVLSLSAASLNNHDLSFKDFSYDTLGNTGLGTLTGIGGLLFIGTGCGIVYIIRKSRQKAETSAPTPEVPTIPSPITAFHGAAPVAAVAAPAHLKMPSDPHAAIPVEPPLTEKEHADLAKAKAVIEAERAKVTLPLQQPEVDSDGDPMEEVDLNVTAEQEAEIRAAMAPNARGSALAQQSVTPGEQSQIAAQSDLMGFITSADSEEPSDAEREALLIRARQVLAERRRQLEAGVPDGDPDYVPGAESPQDAEPPSPHVASRTRTSSTAESEASVDPVDSDDEEPNTERDKIVLPTKRERKDSVILEDVHSDSE